MIKGLTSPDLNYPDLTYADLIYADLTFADFTLSKCNDNLGGTIEKNPR